MNAKNIDSFWKLSEDLICLVEKLKKQTFLETKFFHKKPKILKIGKTLKLLILLKILPFEMPA